MSKTLLHMKGTLTNTYCIVSAHFEEDTTNVGNLLLTEEMFVFVLLCMKRKGTVSNRYKSIIKKGCFFKGTPVA